MLPTQKSLASHTILVGNDLSKIFKQGAYDRHFFNIANAFFYSSANTNGTFFLVSFTRGAAISLNRIINFL
jgi:hypothetical protein